MEGRKETMLIVTILWNKCKYYRNHYINPSQETWVKWLRQNGLGVSRRTVNRYFRAAQNRIQISRIPRKRHHPIKGWEFQTTLYSLGYLGLMLLFKTGVITWDEFMEYKKNSRAFQKREPKKEKKGLSAADPGYFKDFTFYGGPMTAPG